jgi:putative ABC transport system permease protein
MLSDLIFRWRSLWRRSTAETELDQEMRFHLEQQVEKYVRGGMTREQALRRARAEFGGVEQVKEECRDARGVQLMETLAQDVRYGVRTLRKAPGFTIVAVLTLALGIGANTAIFSVVYGVLLRALPYQEPSRLVVLNETTPRVGMVSVSYPNFLDWRTQSRQFQAMAMVSGVGFGLGGIALPEIVTGQAVSPNFLSMIGVRPWLGRDFDASEEKAGAAPVMMLSYPLWQSHFGGENAVIGRTIQLDGKGFTVIGVLPAEFRWFEKVDFLMPIGVWATNNSSAESRAERGDAVVVARLAAGVPLAAARSEMEGIAARLAQAYPEANDQFGVAFRPIRDAFVSDIRPAVLVLSAGVLFVLLIACANVANLFLMRGAGRKREIALRIAVGAGRGRIVRQMLTESLILSVLGAAFGLAVAVAGIDGIPRLIPMDTLGGATVDLNAAVLLFAAGIAVLSALIFGLTPAINASRAEVQPELKGGARDTGASKSQTRWRGCLVISEVALALILLVGTGLMMKSLYRLLSVDPGFRPERVLSMKMSLRESQYGKDVPILNFWRQVIEGVRTLPGVELAAVGTVVPMTNNHSRTDITVEGMELPKPGSFPHPDMHIVSPEFAGTIGIRLQRGRLFTDADGKGMPGVGLINATLARQLFPNQDPIGKRFMFGHPATDPPKWVTIVGIVSDTRLYGLANPARLEVYVPLAQHPAEEMTLVVRSRVDPAALTSSIRGVVAAIDKDQPIFAIATMSQLVADSVSTRRITLVLLGLFSMLAAALAGIGIFGVISYSVAQRTREIGIRMALGAQRRDVLRMVLVQGLKIVGTGVLTGVFAALGLTRLMTSLLFSVSAVDPITFLAVALLLAVISLVSCYIPARRTLRVDPVIALRYE